MSERGDAAIKLFGNCITLQCGGDEEKALRSKDFREEETAPESPDSQETNEHESTRNSTPDERRSEAGSWKKKAAKKPEKIVPCLRCGSPDTKFCY
ncbi:hypothetical protein C4D60_Mb01t10670 [Musa balbisiana]|uniref:Dof-type domain-containing protein n=1 Tax=Musa balbisiana TaxID=52838 RepID=A0A4S8JNQ8_MUSBA|nr:hypothetical protein C4D60_Mb01t10670 [Musa balbisiana]